MTIVYERRAASTATVYVGGEPVGEVSGLRFDAAPEHERQEAPLWTTRDHVGPLEFSATFQLSRVECQNWGRFLRRVSTLAELGKRLGIRRGRLGRARRATARAAAAWPVPSWAEVALRQLEEHDQATQSHRAEMARELRNWLALCEASVKTNVQGSGRTRSEG